MYHKIMIHVQGFWQSSNLCVTPGAAVCVHSGKIIPQPKVSKGAQVQILDLHWTTKVLRHLAVKPGPH